MASDGIRIHTVGHSTLGPDAFIATLAAHRIQVIADVRRFPGSRRHPHFGAEALAASLRAHGMDYVWLARLGGRRRDPAATQPHPYTAPARIVGGELVYPLEPATGGGCCEGGAQRSCTPYRKEAVRSGAAHPTVRRA